MKTGSELVAVSGTKSRAGLRKEIGRGFPQGGRRHCPKAVRVAKRPGWEGREIRLAEDSSRAWTRKPEDSPAGIPLIFADKISGGVNPRKPIRTGGVGSPVFSLSLFAFSLTFVKEN